MKATVSIFINQTPGSAFCRVFHHTELIRRYEREFEFADGSSDQDILNQVWRIFNVDRPADYTGSSLSMADVVTLDRNRSYEVLGFGYGSLPQVVAGERFTVELPEPTIAEIREWRAAEHAAHRDSSIEAFYRSRNMCRACRGRNHLAGYPEKSCKPCGGTGEFPATPEERVVSGIRNMASSLQQPARR